MTTSNTSCLRTKIVGMAISVALVFSLFLLSYSTILVPGLAESDTIGQSTGSNSTSACPASVASVTYNLKNVQVGAGISLIVTASAFGLAWYLQRRAKASKGLSAILRDKYGHGSLTNFQFLVWTVVFLFTIVLVYMVRIQNNVLTFPAPFPTAAWALMGVNTASAVASKAISQSRKPPKNRKKGQTPLWWMLCEESEDPTKFEPSLARIQMFIWTIVSVFIYVVTVIMMFLGPFYFTLNVVPSVCNLAIADVDPTLVTLMGLSHVAYVGKKYFAKNSSATA